MASIGSFGCSLDRIIAAGAFRNARCYAPERVMAVLRGIAGAPVLALVVDVDTLERSALAKVDRVMTLALEALSSAGVHIVLAARYERERAARLEHGIACSWCLDPRECITMVRARLPGVRIIVVSDNAALFDGTCDADRGIALGRPELASSDVAAAGDTTVRATLWWLLEERLRATSA